MLSNIKRLLTNYSESPPLGDLGAYNFKRMKKLTSILFSVSKTSNLQSLAILLMRLVLGGMMLTHGWAKLSNFETLSTTFPDPIGFGSNVALILIISAEFGCSILLILGIFSRLATIPLIIGMFVAGVLANADVTFQEKEPALLYMSMYVVLLLLGPGKYALDAFIRKKLSTD